MVCSERLSEAAQLYKHRKVGPPWWLLIISPRENTSNVLVMLQLQYDITTSYSKTSGIMLNVLHIFVRYRRELFINKSVLFLLLSVVLVSALFSLLQLVLLNGDSPESRELCPLVPRHDVTEVNRLEFVNPVEVWLRPGHLEQSLILPLLPSPVDGEGVEQRDVGREVVQGDPGLTAPGVGVPVDGGRVLQR